MYNYPDIVHFFLLLFADDIVLISSANGGLQKRIKELENYCEKWKYVICYHSSNVQLWQGARVAQFSKAPQFVVLSCVPRARQKKKKDCGFESESASMNSPGLSAPYKCLFHQGGKTSESCTTLGFLPHEAKHRVVTEYCSSGTKRNIFLRFLF